MNSCVMKRILILIVLCVVGAGLSGCSKKNGGQTDNTLHNRLKMKVKTFDPADVGDVSSHAVANEIFECLYHYHYLKRPFELEPQLAEDLPQVSEDGLTYTIKIKKGILFADDECFPGSKGRQLKANDFIYAWKRLANVKTRSKMWWIFDGKIAGLDEFREYSKTAGKGEVDYDRCIEGLQAPDDHTLVIRLTKLWPQLGLMLAYLPTAPMAKEAVDYYGKDIVSKPVGTGPFKLTVWNRGSYVEMVRNENFRDEYYPSEGEEGDAEKGLLADAGKKIPFVDKITWRIIEEDQPRWLIFLRGSTDLMAIPKDNFGQAISFGQELTEEMKKKNITLQTYQEPCTFWLSFNMEDPVLAANKPLRHAISCAIDRERFIKLFWNGRGKNAYGFIPPNMAGFDPELKDISKREFNPDKARKLIKEAEKLYGGKLPSFRIAMSGTSTTHRQYGQFFEKYLENIGLDIEIECFDWPTYLEKLRKKDLQISFSGWIADYPDTENFLQVYYSKNRPWPNSTNYNSPAFDAIYKKASVMEDCPERTQLYRKAEKIVVEDAPCAFVFHRVGYVMIHGWICNFKADEYKPDAFGYGLSKYIRIDTAKRAAYKGN